MITSRLVFRRERRFVLGLATSASPAPRLAHAENPRRDMHSLRPGHGTSPREGRRRRWLVIGAPLSRSTPSAASTMDPSRPARVHVPATQHATTTTCCAANAVDYGCGCALSHALTSAARLLAHSAAASSKSSSRGVPSPATSARDFRDAVIVRLGMTAMLAMHATVA